MGNRTSEGKSILSCDWTDKKEKGFKKMSIGGGARKKTWAVSLEKFKKKGGGTAKGEKGRNYNSIASFFPWEGGDSGTKKKKKRKTREDTVN